MRAISDTLTTYIDQVTDNFDSIPQDRKILLEQFADYITKELGELKKCDLNFICTHNSRRSHLSQVWAQIAATYYGYETVRCYSGGTEGTAFYKSGIQALRNAGISIEKMSEASNPIYALKYAPDSHPVICFSKKFDHVFNPTSRFCAVMTCAHADQNCPHIPQATIRIPIRYDDPKVADGTDYELAKYEERSLQIATEMFYSFSNVG